MSIISAIQTYIKTYTGIPSTAPVWVDYVGSKPTEYSISPLPGGKIVEEYIDGSSLREFPFAFMSSERTSDDMERMENSGFYETFAEWLETQTEAGALPSLGAGKTAELIEATGWGYLYQEGNSETGIYQIQCRLQYVQE